MNGEENNITSAINFNYLEGVSADMKRRHPYPPTHTPNQQYIPVLGCIVF
jgi:hypothetical protein